MPSEKDLELAASLGLPFDKNHGKIKKPHRFKNGNPGGPGRPKGMKNSLNKAVVDALLADFKKGGIKAIRQVRTKRPADYLKVIASILPKQVEVTVDRFDEMEEDALERAYLGLLEALNDRIEERASEGRNGIEPEARAKLPSVLPPLH